MLISSLSAKPLSPFQYGLREAKTDLERYDAILQTHQAAVSQNCGVTYKGIQRIEIEIPYSASPITLSNYTDFAGVEIVVRNLKKKIVLFEIAQELTPVEVTKEELGKGDYGKNKSLNSGYKMLIIEDQTPWVENRKGYDYSAIRKDVVLLKNGIALNEVIASYDNEVSNPKVCFCEANEKVVIKNLVFTRTEDSKYITNLVSVRNYNNVILSNITINTPQDNDLFGDSSIGIANCSNLLVKNITVNGTYSRSDKFGYGFNVNNVLNSKFEKINAHGKWGVFGTNNMNHVVLNNSNVNRFDIHCYGRDVYCKKVVFRDLYNQFSSVFGEVVFDKCTFIDFIPVLFESSYNAYTPFDLIWKNCTFYLNSTNNYFITTFNVPEEYNSRLELMRKCLPNISMKNCKIHLAGDEIYKWYLFQTNSSRYKDAFDYISVISISNVEVYNSTDKKFEIFSKNVRTTEDIKINIDFISKKNER